MTFFYGLSLVTLNFHFQIEVLCGCTIVTNPGITQLQKIVRHVGVGRGPVTSSQLSSSRAMSSRMSSSVSQDDLIGIDDNMDTLSVAASRYVLLISNGNRTV